MKDYSYALGTMMAASLRQQQIPRVDIAAFSAGVQGMYDGQVRVAPQQADAFIQAYLHQQQPMPSLADFSYSLGMLIGAQLQQQNIEDIDSQAFGEGYDDTMNGQPRMDAEAANGHVAEYLNGLAAEAIEAGLAFLSQNAQREGVLVTASGLQYEVLNSGSGRSPKLSDTVTTHYHGTLVDGTVFDSSVQRGQPASFPVNGVIAGWTEALQMMKEGDKWRLFLPYDLAYGEQGAGGAIGPYATLIFDVELLEVH